MKAILATDKDKAKWEGFVATASDASPFHWFDWRRIFEQNYGLNTFYLMAKDNQAIKGILPLALFKSRISGKFFVSFPVSDSGGI